MATEVVLPQWGMNMREGTVVRWLKQEGDPIAKGEPFAEIETDKINTEFEAPVAGVIAHTLVAEGETVPVGTLVVIIAAPGEAVPRPAPRPTAGPRAAPPAAAPRPGAAAPPAAGPPPGVGVQVVPAARRLAQEHGIDLSRVQGTGPGRRILEEDIRQAVAAMARPAPAGRVVLLAGMRRAIAERMLQSAQTMAQVTLHTEADVTELVQLRHDLLSQWRAHRLRPLDLDLIIKAAARALQEHPQVNATLEGDQIRLLEDVNIGIATALADGLIVPVIRGASEKSLLQIAQELRELSDKARKNALSFDDISGGTFTITSLASQDIDAFTPLINPPQVAILGVGRIVEKPAAFQGAITIRSLMALSLTFDHRALDGFPAAEFLRAVSRYLQQPLWMAS